MTAMRYVTYLGFLVSKAYPVALFRTLNDYGYQGELRKLGYTLGIQLDVSFGYSRFKKRSSVIQLPGIR